MSFQLRQMLDRLEAEEEQKQKTLTQRVKEERVKLEATMAFSRAAALAALAQEVRDFSTDPLPKRNPFLSLIAR